MLIPETLRAACRDQPERERWLGRLPSSVERLLVAWRLDLESVGDFGGCASWIGLVSCEDGTPAVLKMGLPHFEATHEIDALERSKGDPTVLLLRADRDANAMLLERCDPKGTLNALLPGAAQDEVLADLLRRFWRTPEAGHPFRPLSAMTAAWSQEGLQRQDVGVDPGLFREGLKLFQELPASAEQDVLLHTDLHGDNVLRAERHPWLVIDPKPFVGDPAYDATQHLLRICREREAHPLDTIARYADLLGVDAGRVRLWVFARAAVGEEDPRPFIELARTIAP